VTVVGLLFKWYAIFNLPPPPPVEKRLERLCILKASFNINKEMLRIISLVQKNRNISRVLLLPCISACGRKEENPWAQLNCVTESLEQKILPSPE
jgi:hypothetical protein